MKKSEMREYTEIEKRIEENPQFFVTADYTLDDSVEDDVRIHNVIVTVCHVGKDGKVMWRVEPADFADVIHNGRCASTEPLDEAQKWDLLRSIKSGRPFRFEKVDFGRKDTSIFEWGHVAHVRFEFDSMVSPLVKYRYRADTRDCEWKPAGESREEKLPRVRYEKWEFTEGETE